MVRFVQWILLLTLLLPLSTIAQTKPAAVPRATSTNGVQMEVACMSRGVVAPPGYRPLTVVVSGDKRFEGVCSCDGAFPYAKIVGSVLTVGTSYAIVKATHDSKPSDIAKHLQRLEVPKKVVKVVAPKTHKIITARPIRVGSVAVLVVSVGIAGYNLYENISADRAEAAVLAATDPNELSEPSPQAVGGTDSGIYSLKKIMPASTVCGATEHMTLIFREL